MMPKPFSDLLKRFAGKPSAAVRRQMELLVTLYPSLPHFQDFADDSRLAGLRFNSAKTTLDDLKSELGLLIATPPSVPVFFDVKGRQLRVVDVEYKADHVEVILNHPIAVPLPQPVLFKAEHDSALLIELTEGGRRLIFAPHQPRMLVKPGESIHIRDPRLTTGGSQFTKLEKQKIETVKAAGLSRWFLSYVQSQRDVDEFRELVGRDAEVWLKIEDQIGLQYVAKTFRKTEDNIVLVAACGDMYIEVGMPHHILPALKLIVSRDPMACVASRMMLSVSRPSPLDLDEVLNAVINNDPVAVKTIRARIARSEGVVPDLADFTQLAWYWDVGYRRFMLCDNLCLKGPMLAEAVAAVDAFRQSYTLVN